ncbi:MAG: hypothetical protein R3343_08500 [Nitriliruptorales bacterium]|nr:hypothetical protein [Nitriliruptorales bacterium]
MTPRRPVQLALVLALFVSACGGGVETAAPPRETPTGTNGTVGDEATSPEAPRPSASASQDAPPAAVAALDFTAATVDGGTIDGTVYAGGDVALWMWAPW